MPLPGICNCGQSKLPEFVEKVTLGQSPRAVDSAGVVSEGLLTGFVSSLFVTIDVTK